MDNTNPNIISPQPEATPMEQAPAAPVQPEARPMEQAPAAPLVPQKKNKTGLIIGIIIGAIVLIGGIVAAIVIAMAPKPDPVNTAIEKLIKHENQRNLKLEGEVKLSFPESISDYSELTVNLNSQIVGTSLLNASKVSGKLKLKSGDEIDAEIEEVYAESGDLYFRISNAADAIKKYQQIPNGQDETCDYNSLEDETICTELENDSIGNDMTVKLINEIDGEWLKVSVDELKSFAEPITADGMDEGLSNDSTKCLTDFASGINQNTNTIAEMYQKYPFIKSSQKDIAIASKNNPIYKVMIDEKGFSGFMHQMEGFQPVQDFAKCMGSDDIKFDEEKLSEFSSSLPDLYLEIDSSYDITRLYFEQQIEGSEINLAIDLDFAYPEVVNIAEPAEYKNFSKIIEDFSKKMIQSVSE